MGLSNAHLAVVAVRQLRLHLQLLCKPKNNCLEKPFLDPVDIEIVTVGDMVRFIKKSHRFSSGIQY